MSATYARHFADTADVYADMAAQGWNGFSWFNHRTRYECGSRLDRFGHRVPAYLSPDGTIEVSWADGSGSGRWRYYLEIDRSTMALPMMAAKLDKYLELFHRLMGSISGDYLSWHPSEVGAYLLILCRSAARAQNLQELIDRRRLPGRAVTHDHAVAMVAGKLPAWWSETLKAMPDPYARR